jgi:hypothetical protein
VISDDQPDAREGQVGRLGVAERFAVPRKPGNAGGGKGPQFKTGATSGEGFGDWATYQLRKLFRNCGRRCTRKAKAEAGYRFYALYDKISCEDILAHAFTQCRSNKGTPGSTVRTSRILRRMASSGGSANWRLRSGRRVTNRILSEECSSRRPTASSGRQSAAFGRVRVDDRRGFSDREILSELASLRSLERPGGGTMAWRLAQTGKRILLLADRRSITFDQRTAVVGPTEMFVNSRRYRACSCCYQYLVSDVKGDRRTQ